MRVRKTFEVLWEWEEYFMRVRGIFEHFRSTKKKIWTFEYKIFFQTNKTIQKFFPRVYNFHIIFSHAKNVEIFLTHEWNIQIFFSHE